MNFEILIFDCRIKYLSQKRRITDCNEERSGVKRKRIREIKRRKRERKETRRE